MNGLVNDAVRLCTVIWDSLLPTSQWAVVNIAKSKNALFTYPTKYQEIPTSFGYTYDRVPQYLSECGVIEALGVSRWFMFFSKGISEKTTDLITNVARAKKYISEDQSASYYHTLSDYKQRYGPTEPGQYAILINVSKMSNFIRRSLTTIPQFSEDSGILSFLGKVIRFDGEVEKKSVRLLVDNIGSIVTKEEFYSIPRGAKNYKAIVESKKGSLHDSLEKMFNKIKSKFYEDKDLKNALIFVQKDGFGIFVNQRSLLITS